MNETRVGEQVNASDCKPDMSGSVTHTRVQEVPSYTNPQKTKFGTQKPRLERKSGVGLKRKSRVAQKRTKVSPKKPKRKKIDLWREWLVPDNAYRRYTGLRGVYWYWLSRDVRRYEWEMWGGECITCLGVLERWEDGHCGHIIAAQNCGEYLRFNRKNLALQHPHCNSDRITPQASALNALHYDQRYGKGAWDALYALKKVEWKCPTQDEYRTLIEALPSYQQAKASQPTEPMP